jgi:GNAT superfamily N-acetyltransferase
MGTSHIGTPGLRASKLIVFRASGRTPSGSCAQSFHAPHRTSYERLISHREVSHWLDLNQRLVRCGLPPVPVTSVLSLFESCFDTVDGVLRPPGPADRFVGQHQVRLTGYYTADEDMFGFVNSWGGKWGDQGYGSVGKTYFEQYCTESWVHRVGDHGLNLSSDFEPFDPALTCDQLVEQWQRTPSGGSVMLPRKRWLYWYRASRFYRNGYTVIGEISDARGLMLGWCHVDIGTSDGVLTAAISELFVWPLYRQTGVGSQLLRWARGVARDAKCIMMQVLVYDADIESGYSLRRDEIAQRLGIQWFDGPDARGNGIGAIAGEYL